MTSTLETIAEARGGSASANQILFKWLQAKGLIAVTTTTKEWRLKEYLKTDRLCDLTEEEVNQIEQSTDGAHYRFLVFSFSLVHYAALPDQSNIVQKLGSFIDDC